MCDLNGPFRLCNCSVDIDYSSLHWILHMNSTPVENLFGPEFES